MNGRASLDLLCLKRPLDGSMGLQLPRSLLPFVMDPSGPERIVAVYRQGQKISQRQFGRIVTGFWHDLAPRSRAILAQRLLNPRAYNDSQHFKTAFGDSEDFAAAEIAAAAALFENLQNARLTLTCTDFASKSRQQHYYFIPLPPDDLIALSDASGLPVSRGSFKSIVRGKLLPEGRITARQAMLGFNAYASLFPLGPSELVRLNPSWRMPLLASELAAFTHAWYEQMATDQRLLAESSPAANKLSK